MSMKNNKKVLALAMALILIVGAVIGGTVAYLITNTDPLVNTFTVGDINITLTESPDLDLKMVPGKELTKDPKVTVKADSEACWLFVKVEESNVSDFLTYSVDSSWTALSGQTGVYYKQVSALTSDQVFSVLTDNKVTVKDSVTKTMLTALTESTYPKLTFTAYAVQQDGITSAADAWAKANGSN